MDFKIDPDAGQGFASGASPKNPENARDANARTDAFLKRVLIGA